MGRRESFPSLAKMNLLNKNSLGCGRQKCFYTWTTIDLGDPIYVYYSKAIWFSSGVSSQGLSSFIVSALQIPSTVSVICRCAYSLSISTLLSFSVHKHWFCRTFYNKLAWGFEKIFVNKVCWGIYFNRLFPHLLSVRHQLKVFFHL